MMKPTTEQRAQLVAEVREDVIKWRRHLHQNPELSFAEVKTSQFVYDTLQSFGGLELSRPTKTSVMARLIGSRPGKTLAIRADMDALPIVEDNTFEFVSQNPGVMHACGHDGHTAMLLGTAKILTGLTEHINGEVRFLFQHAEELPPGGAVQMVEAGVMDGVDMVIGIHLVSIMETGLIAIGPGPMQPALGNFDISIIGKGGHGASPHETVDSLAIAAQVVTNLQHIVSRYTNPLEALALSVTKIQGGALANDSAYNVIPETIHLAGTVRSFNSELLDSVPALMERVIQGITHAHGATYRFEYHKGYDTVINDAHVTSLVKEALLEAFDSNALLEGKPMMPGEDFSEFQKKAPGTFFYVGAGNQAKGIVHPHHHPKFTIDETCLSIGVESFVVAVFKLLE